MIRGVNHFAISSTDITRLARFYMDVFGFSRATEEFSWRNNPVLDRVMGLRDSVGRQQMLRAGNCYLELFQFSAPASRVQPPVRAADRGYTHIAFDVADIDSEVGRLKQAGVVFLCDEPIALGTLRAIYAQDPDGNLIELIEPEPEHPYSLNQVNDTATYKLG